VDLRTIERWHWRGNGAVGERAGNGGEDEAGFDDGLRLMQAWVTDAP
jgi:hypothetical protein